MKTLHKSLLAATCFGFLSPDANTTALAQDVAAAARANRARTEPRKNESEWRNATRVSVVAEEGSVKTASTYEINGDDLRIIIESDEQGKRETAELMLINGRRQWMLAKNLSLEKGYEIDALDGAVLNLKLVLELMDRAAPSGAGQIINKTNIFVDEKSRSIQLSTASASGGIEAPWKLQGTIEPLAAGQFGFEITLKTTETVRFKVTWEKDATPPVFADDTPLDGWQILTIGPYKAATSEGTIYDYGAQASKKRPKSLGELRGMTQN